MNIITENDMKKADPHFLLLGEKAELSSNEEY